FETPGPNWSDARFGHVQLLADFIITRRLDSEIEHLEHQSASGWQCVHGIPDALLLLDRELHFFQIPGRIERLINLIFASAFSSLKSLHLNAHSHCCLHQPETDLPVVPDLVQMLEKLDARGLKNV